MYEPTPLQVYGVKEEFSHVVQITSPIVGQINVRVDTDDEPRISAHDGFIAEPEIEERLPEIVIHVSAEAVRRIRVVDDFGSTWYVDLSGLRPEFEKDYQWKAVA